MKIEILYAVDYENNNERTSLLAAENRTSLDRGFVEEKVKELLLDRYGMTDRQIEELVDAICEGDVAAFGAYGFHWETVEMQPIA